MTNQRMGVYCPKPIMFIENKTTNLPEFLKQIGVENFVAYANLNEFKDAPNSKKIMVIEIINDHPSDMEYYETLMSDEFDTFDQIVVLLPEVHFGIVDFAMRYDHAKVAYFVSGRLNFELKHSPVHNFFFWFNDTRRFYQDYKPELLEQELSPYEPKPKFFDALLGSVREHRDLIHRVIDRKINIVTYLKGPDKEQSNFSNFIWEDDGVVKPDDVTHTTVGTRYYGHHVFISQIAPLKIYKQTAYSIVTESNADDHYVFYTEKTVKPILARRLFIAVAGRYFLQGLRDIGFKTFDGIIDESYDSAPTFQHRVWLASKEIERLQQIPQAEILEQIKPICDHNYQHLMSTDWIRGDFAATLAKYFSLDEKE